LKHGNPTVVNVILNIQPVISSRSAHFLLFGDRLVHRFFLYAGIAIVAASLFLLRIRLRSEFLSNTRALNLGTGYALICALF